MRDRSLRVRLSFVDRIEMKETTRIAAMVPVVIFSNSPKDIFPFVYAKEKNMLALAAVVFLFVGVGACLAVTVEGGRAEKDPTRKEKVVHREEEVSPLITRRTTSPARSDSPVWEMV